MSRVLSKRERFERFWDSRTKESELNFAIFNYAARSLAEGDVEALLQIGFVPEDIPVIEQLRLSDLHSLAASRAHALDVRINRESLQWLMERVRRRRTREMLKLELLRLEAPYPMMQGLFGMTPRDYAALRDTLGVSGGLGRPRTNLDDDDTGLNSGLWRLWIQFGDTGQPDRLRYDDLWLVIGREQRSALRVAWHVIQRWAHDPVTRHLFDSERARLPDAEIMREEHALRQKHGINPIGIDNLSVQLPDSPATSEVPRSPD